MSLEMYAVRGLYGTPFNQAGDSGAWTLDPETYLNSPDWPTVLTGAAGLLDLESPSMEAPAPDVLWVFEEKRSRKGGVPGSEKRLQ